MIYLLERIGSTPYDDFAGMVVRADSPTLARATARGTALPRLQNTEEADVWLDPERTICIAVNPEGEEDVILEDFNAG